MMKRAAVIGVLLPAFLLGAAGVARAGSGLGSERVGTASGSFLKIGVGAKAVGLGEAFTAVADDATTVFWNPAGLTNLEGRHAHFSHAAWIADIDYEYIAYAQSLPYLGGLNAGIQIGSLRTDMMETTIYQPYGTGREFTYSDLFIGVAAARRFTDKLSLGIGVKYIRENYGSAIGGPVVNTFSADFGTYYFLGAREAVFAVTLRNFGPEWQPDGTYIEYGGDDLGQEKDFQKNSSPTSFQAGFQARIWSNDMFRQIGVIEMSRPPDNSEAFRIATELTYMDMLALRTGYNLNADELKWSGGLGVLLETSGVTNRVDYAFTYSEYLERIDRISWGVEF